MQLLPWIVCFACFSSTVAGAQENTPLVVSPVGELPLRSNPPGLFSGRGEQIGAVEPGEKYIVLEKKTVPSIFGSQEWLKVQPVSPDVGGAGWTFSGSGGGMQNFTVQPFGGAIQ